MEVENPMVLPFEEIDDTVGFCVNCNATLYSGDVVLSTEEGLMCDNDCLYSYYNITERYGYEVCN